MIGPEEILQAAVEYCDQSDVISLATVRKDFEARLKKRAKERPERAAQDRKEVEEWLEHAQTDVGDMRCYFRWLFAQERFRIAKIVSCHYLPETARHWTRGDWATYSSRAAEARKREWASPDEANVTNSQTDSEPGGESAGTGSEAPGTAEPC